MGDEDGWGNVVDLLQKYKKEKNVKRKEPGTYIPNGLPIPPWMQKCIYGVGYEAAEYLEMNVEFFTTPPRKKKMISNSKENEPTSAGTKDEKEDLLDVVNEKPLETNNLDIELLAGLKKILEDLQKNALPPYTMPPQFSYLRETPLLSEALAELSLFTLGDEMLAEISHNFISLKGSSYVQCLCFSKHALLPKVKSLTTTASRALVGGIIHCAKLHPAPLMHGLLIPLVTDDTGSVQSEVVNRIAFVEKSLSPELCIEFLREIVSKKQVWTDPFVVLITNALNINIQLNDEIASLVVTHAGKQVDNFVNNAKFAKLILILITKYPALAKPHTVPLQQILAKCKNFMAKSALTQLEKL